MAREALGITLKAAAPSIIKITKRSQFGGASCRPARSCAAPARGGVQALRVMRLSAGGRQIAGIGVGRGVLRGSAGQTWLGGAGDRRRQADGEHRAAARLALDEDFAAHQPAELLGSARGQARCRHICSPCPASAWVKLLEELGEVAGADADAGVAHGDGEPIAPGVGARGATLSVMRAIGGELGGVAEQVQQRLAQLGRVADDDADIGAALDRERRCRSSRPAAGTSRRPRR